jgi:hypothetical protein
MGISVKQLLSIGFVAALAVLFTAMPEVALAQTSSVVGSNALNFLDQGLIRGNWGTIIGLVIALFGLYVWLIRQETWGVVVIIGGVLVTFFPGVFDTLDEGLRAVVNEFDSTTTVSQGTNAQTN